MEDDFGDFQDCPDIVKQLELAKKQGEAGDGAAPRAGRSKAKAKAKAAVLKICFITTCDSQCLKGKRWCKPHNQTYDNMHYQARKAGEVEALDEAMGNSATATAAMEEFEEMNPSDGKWKRKQLINWSQFKRLYCVSQIRRSRQGTRPFEHGEWMIRGEKTMGWSKSATQTEWDKHFKDPSIHRDKLGIDKSDRLWIPVIEERHRDTDHIKSSMLEEGGAQEKQLSADDRRVLLAQCKSNLRDRDPDSFFTHDAEDTEETPPPKGTKRGLEEADEAQTPAEKKLKAKLDKLSSSGPAFTAFKNAAATKVEDKLAAHVRTAQVVRAKMNEARTATEEYKNALTEKDAVVDSWQGCVAACGEILATWDYDIPNPAGDNAQETFEKYQVKLEDTLKRLPDVKLVKGDSKLFPKGYFECQAHVMRACKTAQEVNDIQTALMKTHLCTVDLFLKSILKICNDAQSYIKQKKASQDRSEARKKRQQEAEQTLKAKEAAKNAAQKARMFSKQAHPIFGIKEDSWKAFLVHSGENFDVAANVNKPWVMRASAAAKTWRNHSDSSVKLSEFGGAYRKTPSIKVDGRAMAPVLQKQGKEQGEAMMQKFAPTTKLLDLSKLSDGALFQANLWYWGFDNKMSGAFLAPNAASLIRVVAMGSVSMVAFDVAKIVTQMEGVNKAPNSLSDVTDFILSLDDTYFIEHADENLGYATTLNQDDICFVPQGWIIAEQVSSTSSLTYGVRKSYLIDDVASKNSYLAAVKLLKSGGGRNTEKMEEVAKQFSADAVVGDGAAPAAEAAQAAVAAS
ncbi:unnamed protein product [Symbiodinium sp. CCMP2592]|nr:unnamed protein product [Symbiodinium sp. CCMP2592]